MAYKSASKIGSRERKERLLRKQEGQAQAMGALGGGDSLGCLDVSMKLVFPINS